ELQLVDPGTPFRRMAFPGGSCCAKRGSERQVQTQLQEPRAADGVLNHAQTALGRVQNRTFIVVKEIDVVVRGVEIGMVEYVECVGLKAQTEALLDGELFRQTHIEAHLERTTEEVAAGIAIEGFVVITAGGVTERHSVGTGRDKLRCKIAGIENRSPRVDAEGALEFRLRGSYTSFERHDGIPNFVIAAEVQAADRTGIVVDAVGLAAFRHGLPTDDPTINRAAQSLVFGQ